MQVRTNVHMSKQSALKEEFEKHKRSLTEDMKRFFKLFEESTFEGSRAAAQKMKKLAKQQTKLEKEFLLRHSLYFLIRSSNSEKLSWPNSPLLVMLHFVDPNVLFGTEEPRVTLLHRLTELADPFDYSTHVNQLILAKQLIKHFANVNAAENQQGMTPLHRACFSNNVTNLDFVEYLLEAGADPNAQDHYGLLGAGRNALDFRGSIPLMYTIPDAPGAAKFLLNWPTTDANITTRSGMTFLARVRLTITWFSDEVALPDNPETVQHEFLLQQWRAIEEMLVLAKRGAADTGTTTLE
jgi:hypothetical protein